MITVPELPGDVHDLDGLRAMNEHLFAMSDSGRARRSASPRCTRAAPS